MPRTPIQKHLPPSIPTSSRQSSRQPTPLPLSKLPLFLPSSSSPLTRPPIRGTTQSPLARSEAGDGDSSLDRIVMNRGEVSVDDWLGDTGGQVEDGRVEQVGVEGNEVSAENVLVIHAPYGYTTFSAAYYDPAKRILHVLEDTKDTWTYDLATIIMEQVSPGVVIYSDKTPDKLVEVINRFCEEHPTTKPVVQPSNPFTPGVAAHQLSILQLPDKSCPFQQDPTPSNNGSTRDQEDEVRPTTDNPTSFEEEYGYDTSFGMGKMRLAMVKLGSWINVNAPSAICATGGLISYLVKQSSVEFPTEVGRILQLNSIESMALDYCMLINEDALRSLGVFDMEAHGSIFRSQKEGASLFGLLNTTITPLGSKLFRTWFLRPLLDLRAIKSRHDAVALLSSVDTQAAVDGMCRNLKMVKNVADSMQKIVKGKDAYKDWKGLMDTLAAVRQIQGQALTLALTAEGKGDFIEKLKAMLSDALRKFSLDLTGVIDWDTSKDEKRMCIQAGIDDELDEYRDQYAVLDPLLTATAHQLVRRVPTGFVTDLQVLYLPQYGCLVCCSGLEVDGSELLVPPPEDWKLQFDSDDNHYFKCPEMIELDGHFGDLGNKIQDRECEIVQVLKDRLVAHEQEILKAVDAIAELDCLLALAKAVSAYNLVRPTMKEEPVLAIKNGRHILQELWVKTYLANDTVLMGGHDEKFRSMMIITGANGSGKSAYGKQVALITFMAQIGSFVPAEMAEIGICDRIYTRLNTRESSSRPASAFMIDLSQVSLALRGLTPRSLLILDEFGKGTSACDGAGLLAGTIQYLIDGIRPRTVIMTHFHELFSQAIIPPTLPITFCHMKTELIQGSDSLTYFYKLEPRLSRSSYAVECALHNGLSLNLVKRARAVNKLKATFQLSKLLDEELTPEDYEDLERDQELMKSFLMSKFSADGMDVCAVLMEMLSAHEEIDEGMEEGDEVDEEDDIIIMDGEGEGEAQGQGSRGDGPGNAIVVD